MQMSYLYALDFPLCKLAQHTETIRKNVLEKGKDAYSLTIRVQTTINHISIFTFLCFLSQYQRQRKCSFSEREWLKKTLRDTLTRAAWLRRNFPFRKQAMPFSQHLEKFLTLNNFFSTKLKKKEIM